MSRGEAKVIVNPTAGGGRVGQRWPEIEGLLSKAGLQFEHELTQHRNHATEIARKAVDDGHHRVICVGGDGTVNETVNGLVRDGRVPPDVSLGIIPCGTGSDFRRSVGIDCDPCAAIETALGDSVRAVDVGEIECTLDGKPVVRYFVNIAGLGFDAEVALRANGMTKLVSGTVTYLASLVLTLISYRNKDIRLVVDGQEQTGRFNSVVVCNGQYFAGGMWMGPKAAADDGILDVVLLRDMGKLEFLATVPKVYKGRHLEHPKVEPALAKVIHVESDQPMYVQAEGEFVGEAPATFRVIPGALNLRA